MEQFYKFSELTHYPVIIAQLYLSLIVTALVGVEFSQLCPQHGEHIAVQTRPALRELQFSLQATLQPQLLIYSTLRLQHGQLKQATTSHLFFPALLLSAKADDIVEASSELDGIIVILGGFRWIHNERYLDKNTFESLLMLHTIDHNYAQWTCLCPSTTLTFSHRSIPDSIDTRCSKLDG